MHKVRQYLLLTVVPLFCLTISAKELNFYYSPYYDSTTDLYGLKYGDEVCLLPQYEGVTVNRVEPLFCDNYSYKRLFNESNHHFAYKSGGKWGIATVLGSITEPKYDGITFTFGGFPIVKNNGKMGILGFSGEELAPCRFDSIGGVLMLEDAIWPWDVDKHPLLRKNIYYMAKENGQNVIIDILGNKVADTKTADEILIAQKQSDYDKLKKLFKRVIKLEDKRYKTDKDYLTLLSKKRGENIIPFASRPFSNIAPYYINIHKINGIPYLFKGNYVRPLDPKWDYKVIPQDLSTYDLENKIKQDVYFIFGKNDKWGVMDFFGDVVINPDYDLIEAFNGRRDLFTVKKEGKEGIIDNLGKEIVPIKYKEGLRPVIEDGFVYIPAANFDGKIDYYSMGIYLDTNKKAARKKYFSPEALEYNEQNRIARNQRFDELDAKLKSSKPEGVEFYEYNGRKWPILPNGLDLMIITQNSPEERLKRNPNSLVGLALKYINSESNNYNANRLEEILAAAEKMGYGDSDLARYVRLKYKDMSAFIARQEKERERRERVERFNARVDAIAGAMISTLYTAMDAYDSATSSYSSDSSYENGSRKGNKSNSSDFKLSKQDGYNSDKRVYENYDSMLSAYFAGNRQASVAEAKKWQNAMKSLRKKWEDKGKSFPHSGNEDKSI